jgi:hypothetical protein
MKTYGGVDVQIHVFLSSSVIGGEWSASCFGRFTAEERAPGTSWIGVWVGPTTGLTTWRGEKYGPYQHSNSDPSAVQSLPSRYADSLLQLRFPLIIS